MDNDILIKVEDLCKIYNPGENEVRALDHVSLEIKKGELVAIIGQTCLAVWMFRHPADII